MQQFPKIRQQLTGDRKEITPTKVNIIAGKISRLISNEQIASEIKFKILNISAFERKKFIQAVLTIIEQKFRKELNNLIPKD